MDILISSPIQDHATNSLYALENIKSQHFIM